jgi:hypothetical protein
MKLIASGVTWSAAEDEIAFVLAILLVDEDHHAAGGQLGDELGNGGDGHGEL